MPRKPATATKGRASIAKRVVEQDSESDEDTRNTDDGTDRRDKDDEPTGATTDADADNKDEKSDGVRHPLFLMRKRWLKHAKDTPMFLCEPLRTVDGKPMYTSIGAKKGAMHPSTAPRQLCVGWQDIGPIKPLWNLPLPPSTTQRFFTMQDFAVEECVRLREKRCMRGSTNKTAKSAQ